jgi:hypothetical protein
MADPHLRNPAVTVVLASILDRMGKLNAEGPLLSNTVGL